MANFDKAIAVFIASRPHNGESDAYKQMILRAVAEKYRITIVAFMAIPKTSLLKHLQHALMPLKSSAAHTIIIDEAPTLFLPPADLRIILHLLAAHKARLIIANTGTNFEPEHLEALSLFLGVSSSAEGAQRGKKIKKSLLRKKREGLVLGGKRFGIDDSEQAIVKQIFDLRASGKSLQKICDLLAANDIKSVRHKKWHPTTLKRIIERHLAISKTLTPEKA